MAVPNWLRRLIGSLLFDLKRSLRQMNAQSTNRMHLPILDSGLSVDHIRLVNAQAALSRIFRFSLPTE